MGEVIKNARISEADVQIVHGAMIVFHLQVTYGDSTFQGFGDHVLHNFNHGDWRDYPNVAGHHIAKVLQILEADSVRKCVGKNLRVKIEGGFIRAIGHWSKDEWFNPTEEYKQLKQERLVVTDNEGGA